MLLIYGLAAAGVGLWVDPAPLSGDGCEVDPRAFDVTTADGQTLSLRGGYYPIKYDPAASLRAEQPRKRDCAPDMFDVDG